MDSTIQLFKALSDKSRLKIIASLVDGPMYVELLAQRLNLSASTVSFHLKKLEECGLVSSYKDQYYVMFTLKKEILENKIIDIIKVENIDNSEDKKREDSYRKEIIDVFFEGGKLKSIPVQKEKKKIVLEEIAKLFREGKGYNERQVNVVLSEISDDFPIIKTELIKYKLIKFHKDEFYVGDKTKLLESKKKGVVPAIIESKLRIGENVVFFKKNDFTVEVKDSSYKDNECIALYFTDIGRLLIQQKSNLKKFDISNIYSYNYVTQEEKDKMSIIYYNDVDTRQLEYINKDNIIFCTGSDLIIKSENGLRSTKMNIKIKFTIEEFNDLVKNMNKELFKNIDG